MMNAILQVLMTLPVPAMTLATSSRQTGPAAPAIWEIAIERVSEVMRHLICLHTPTETLVGGGRTFGKVS